MKKNTVYFLMLFSLLVMAIGCESSENDNLPYASGDADNDSDSDSDADSDGDSDGDSDADSDTDGDNDTDTDTDSDTDTDTDTDGDTDSDTDTDGDTDCIDEDDDDWCADFDCDDGNSDVNPGHDEVDGNNVDDDCDGVTDEGGPDTNTTQGCSKMDILFVVDNSGSMQQEQENLAANFPQFIKVLDSYDPPSGEQFEYRVGVTTTAVNRNYKEKILTFPAMPMSSSGEDGVLQGLGSCPGMTTDRWISGPAAEVSTQFSCAANVGTTGSATEMPFAGMEAALDKQAQPGMPNEGFYRENEDSLLVVVIITDEDDCSVKPGGLMTVPFGGGASCAGAGLYQATDMKQFLIDTTGAEGRFVVVGIAGPNNCSSEFGDAINAKRVKELVDECGEYGVFGNICSGDLASSLNDALDVMKDACDEFPPVV